MVDKIDFGEAGNHEQRQARSISAAALRRPADGAVERRRRRGESLLQATLANAGAVQGVVGGERRIDDGRHLVVVPAVGIVIGDDHRRVRPFGALLQRIDDAHDESLLVDGVGIAGMSILIGRRLEEAHGRKIPRVERVEKVMNVIGMIRRIDLAGERVACVADGRHRLRTRMGGVSRRGVILEPCVVRDVIGRGGLRRARRPRRARPRATARAIGIGDRQIESAHERAPGDIPGVEQIADVRAVHRHLVGGGFGACVEQGIGVADYGVIAIAVLHFIARMQKFARSVDDV